VTPLFEDNSACIEWGNNFIGGRERAKHIDIRKHYAHYAIQLGHVRLIHVSTSDQFADVLTKGFRVNGYSRSNIVLASLPFNGVRGHHQDRVPH
jgi:hypothetical protein